MKLAYGVWDYIKNRAPERDRAENWAIEWIGSLPGKRENRRYVGDHTLTQNDVRASGQFADIIGYGGWSMDDHHPAGIFYPGEPTIFHPAPSPFGIPYRSLYSLNISNLLFAGRNISVTHAALSSTRVMATCAVLGQAAGTAAALCVRHRCDPRSLSSGERLRELQEIVMDDDCWLPGMARPISKLALGAKLSGLGSDIPAVIDGVDRDRPGKVHAWSGGLGEGIEYHWPSRTQINGARIVFDSNLELHKRMPCSYPHRSGNSHAVPASLVKTFRIEAADSAGEWRTIFRESQNHQRLVRIPLRVSATSLRLVVDETWGDPRARVFAFDPLDAPDEYKMPQPFERPLFADLRAAIGSEDLAPPKCAESKSRHRIGA
jgi:hypothetical protein